MQEVDLALYAGKKIKDLRLLAGYTQEELADKLQMKKSAISNYENGTRTPKQDTLFALSNLFKVGVDTFFPNTREEVHSYPYFEADIAAGAMTTVEGLTASDVDQIELSDAVMGRYAGDSDLFVTNINGESMNRVIPNHSLVVVKHVDSFEDLTDGEIVIFSEDDEDYSVKRFYNDAKTQIINFVPDSTETSYHPINFRYEDMEVVKIIGRVVLAVVEF